MAAEDTLFYQIKGILLAHSRGKKEQKQIEEIFTSERSKDTAFTSRLKLFWTRFISANPQPTLNHFRDYLHGFEVENRYDSKYWWEELAPGRSSQCDACGAHISRRLITLSNDSQLIRLGDTCEHHLREDFSLFGLDLEQKTQAKERKRKTRMAAQLEEIIQALPGYLASQPERFLNAIRSSLREELKTEYREKLETRLQNLDYYLQSHWVSQDNLTRKLLSEMQPDVNFLNTLLANPHLSEEDKLAARKLCGSLSELTAEEAQKIFQQVLCYKYINLPMTLNEVVSDIRLLHKKGRIADENYQRIHPLLDLEEVLVIEALTIANTVPNLRQLRIEENKAFLKQYPEFTVPLEFSSLFAAYYSAIIDEQTKTPRLQKDIRAALEKGNLPLSDKEIKMLKQGYDLASNNPPSLDTLLREIPIEEFQEIARTAVTISRKAAAAKKGIVLKGSYLPKEELSSALLSAADYDAQETSQRIAERWLCSEYNEEIYQRVREKNRGALEAGLFPDTKEFLTRVAKVHSQIKRYPSIEEYLALGKEVLPLVSFIKEVEAAGLVRPASSCSAQSRFFHPRTVSSLEERGAIYRQMLDGLPLKEIEEKMSFLRERELVSRLTSFISGRDPRTVYLSSAHLSRQAMDYHRFLGNQYFEEIFNCSKLEEAMKRLTNEWVEITPEKRKELERALSAPDKNLVHALYYQEILWNKEPSKERIYFLPEVWKEIEAYNLCLDKIAEYKKGLSSLLDERQRQKIICAIAENLPLFVGYAENAPFPRIPIHPLSEEWLICQYQLAKHNDEHKKNYRFQLQLFDLSPLIEYGKEFYQDGKKARVTLVNRYSPERHHIGQRFEEVVSALPEFRTDKDSRWLVTSRIDYKEINGLLWKVYQLNRRGGIDLAVELKE